MKSLSPVDAIGPAFARARSVLLPPGMEPGRNARFRFWFLMKVALVGAFTQPGAYGASIALFADGVIFALFVFGGLGNRLPGFESLHGGSPGMLAVVLLLGAVGLAVWVLLGWLWARLRFTFFEMVVVRHGRVGLAWSRYPVQAWRFLGLIVLLSFGFLLLLAATAGPFAFHLYRVLHRLTPQQINADPFLVIAPVVPLYGIIFAGAILIALVDAMQQDFMIPPMALEDAPVEFAFGRFLHLLRTQPGYVALYFLLRFALQVGLSMAGGIVVAIVFGIFALCGIGVGFVFYSAVIHRGNLGFAVFVVFCIVAGLAGLAVYLLAIVLVNGSIAVFRQCYAVQFYGPFYAPLGVHIDPESGGSTPPNPPPLPVL
jgi:hypothetical protein